MSVIPAVVAGVGEVIVLTPPDEDGGIDPATLVAADMTLISVTEGNEPLPRGL